MAAAIGRKIASFQRNETDFTLVFCSVGILMPFHIIRYRPPRDLALDGLSSYVYALIVEGRARACSVGSAQVVPIGTELGKQILRLQQNVCLFRFTDKQDDVVVA